MKKSDLVKEINILAKYIGEPEVTLRPRKSTLENILVAYEAKAETET